MSGKDYDILARIKFFPQDEGGRETATQQESYGCPMIIKDKYFDCRLLLDKIGQINPGDDVVVPIKFLDADAVLSVLSEKDTFKLWEMGIIAEGVVLEKKHP